MVETGHHIGICIDCGSDLYRLERRGRRPIRCKGCLSLHKKGSRSWAEYVLEVKTSSLRKCVECSKDYQPTRGNKPTTGPQRFCSRECANAERRRLADARKLRRQAIRAEARTYRHWSKRAKERARAAERTCECGKPLERYEHRCEGCRADWKKALRRTAKALGRARLRAATVERFDPMEVLERDGWRCYICGIDTPKHLRGTNEDAAPELEHMIPLAFGGEHSRRNTACACRKCNIAKSDKLLSEFGRAGLGGGQLKVKPFPKGTAAQQ